jgi:hypothetical protein
MNPLLLQFFSFGRALCTYHFSGGNYVIPVSSSQRQPFFNTSLPVQINRGPAAQLDIRTLNQTSLHTQGQTRVTSHDPLLSLPALPPQPKPFHPQDMVS